MGPPENPTRHLEKQWARRRRRAVCRPRARKCLLKGCEQWFRPRHARQRYCGKDCQKQARQWAQRKARRGWGGTGKGEKKKKRGKRRDRGEVRKRKKREETQHPEQGR